MPMTATGQIGQVRWGYHSALSFSAWRFEGAADGGTITATIGERHAVYLDQEPLTVVVDVGNSRWKFPLLGWQESGKVLTIQVGPRERT